MQFKLFGIMFDLRPLLSILMIFWSGFVMIGIFVLEDAEGWFVILWIVATILLLTTQRHFYSLLEEINKDDK